jgi:hypothetical protein
MPDKLKIEGIPVMGPDGHTYDIPQAEVYDALKEGGQLVVPMAGPDGARYWIPTHEVENGLNEGGQLLKSDGTPFEEGTAPRIVGHNGAGQPIWGSAAEPEKRGFVGSAWDAVKGAWQGVGNLMNPMPTDEERQQGLTTPYDYALRPFERVVEPQVQMAQQFSDELDKARAGGPDALQHGLEAARHFVGAAVPGVGPWVVETQDQMARQLAEGDTSGALGTEIGNMAVAAAPEVGERVPGAARAALDRSRGWIQEKMVPRTGLETPIAPGEMSPLERFRAATKMDVNLDLAQATNAPIPRMAKTFTEKSLSGGPQFEANNAANVQALHEHAGNILNSAAEPIDRRAFGEQVQQKLAAHRAALTDEPGQTAAAQQLLDGIHPQAMTRSQFGAAAKGALEEHLATVRDQENQIYSDLDQRIGDKPPKVKEIRQSARNIYDANKRFYDEHPEALTGGDARAWKWVKDVAGIDKDGKVSPVDDTTGLRNWSDLQTARSHLLDLTRGKDVVGARPTAWLKTLTGKIDETMTDGARTPGMTPQDVKDFRTANEMHKGLKETYDNNQSPFYWLLRDDPSAVADRISSMSPENFQRMQESMNSINRGDVISQARRQFANSLLDPKGSGTIDLAGLPNRWKNADKPTVEGILQPDHMVALGDIADKASRKTVYDTPGSQLKQIVEAPDGTTAAQKMFDDSGKMLLTPEEVRSMEQADPDLVPMLRRQAIERQFDPAGNGTVDLRNFASRWGRAQKEPLEGVLTPEQMKDLNDLASVSRTVNMPVNPSGTATVLQPASEAGHLLSAGTGMGLSTVGAATGAGFGGPLGAAIGNAAGTVADVVGKGIIAHRLIDPEATAAVMEHTPPTPMGTAIKNAAVGTVENLPQSAMKASLPAAQNQNQREGVSTPPNSGQVSDVTASEPNEVHNAAKEQAAMAATGSAGAPPPGGPAPGSSGGVVNLQDPSGNVIYRPSQAPEGATHEVIHPDGKTVLGHVVNGEYVPLDTGGSGE